MNNSGPTSTVRGVGIYCAGAAPVLHRCLIANNSPIGNGNFHHYGAGIYLAAFASPTFETCQIIDNLLAQSIYHYNHGGGIYCDNSAAHFRFCEISGNSADYGGGIQAVNSSSVTFNNCTFDSNLARHTGGAIQCGDASLVEVDSCLLIKNKAQQNGGALFSNDGGQINALHSTITDNRASDDFEGLGAGVYAGSGTSPVLTDCIVFYNWSSEIYPSDLTTITHCDVRGGYPGSGNIDHDPLFCDWVNGDYHIAGNSPCLSGGLMGRYGIGGPAVYPRTIHVPVDIPLIQDAIYASYQGDTVLVDIGSYPENINFWGRRILLASNFIHSADTAHISQTIIDGGGAASGQSVVSLIGAEDSLSILAGFTLSNGYSSGTHGGGITIKNHCYPIIQDCWIKNNSGPTSRIRGVGIYCTGSTPLIRRCRIVDNGPIGNGNFNQYGAGIYLGSFASPSFQECQIIDNLLLQNIYHRNYGGGIYCENSSPYFRFCEISGNSADYGGGIQAVNSSSVTFNNCTFDSNLVRHTGGAIHCGNASIVDVDSCLFIKNMSWENGGALYSRDGGQINALHSTITDNRAGDDFEGLGAGVYAEAGTSPTLTDCIVFYNWSSEIYPSDLTTITYCDVRGGYTGSGNIDYDPFFCDWVNGDYHIASNSLCVIGGSGGDQIGLYGIGCAAVYPRIFQVPADTALIQDAIFASYQGDTVLVDIGSYSENINFWGRRIVLASNYIHSGNTAHISQTIIDGGGAASGQSVVSMVGAEDNFSILAGFTLTNGYCSGTHGGGITIKNHSTSIIQNCWIQDNSGPASQARGAGIFCDASSPTIDNCRILNNSITINGNSDHFGGGVYIANSAAPNFNHCDIIDNQIAFSIYGRNYGGGIYCDNSLPYFRFCKMSGNSADYGGGIQAVNSSNVTFNNCTFDSNLVRHTGGAIHCSDASIVEVDSCLFIKNMAQQNGGALYSNSGGQINALHSTITDNRAGDDFERLGAGVYAESGTSPALTHCIVFYNWSSEIYPLDLTTISDCDVRGGYPGSRNIDHDPLFCDWLNGDYYIASNSPCSSPDLMGRYGIGCAAVYPRTFHVPADTALIQDAIFASYQGDTVLVDIGSYPENINFWGRRIVLTSNYIHSADTAHIYQTIIDGGGATSGQSVVSMVGAEDSLSILAGLTLTNGYCSANHGGGITIKNHSYPIISNCWIQHNSGPESHARGVGIFCSASSPTIENCRILNNSITTNGNYDHFGGGAYIANSSEPNFYHCEIRDNQIAFSIYGRNYGGGAYCNNSSPVFRSCRFSGNSADHGGGIEITDESNAIIHNSYFSYNTARSAGGALYLAHSDPQLINNTISRNSAGFNGGGIFSTNSDPVIMNMILWEDSAPSGAEIEVLTGPPLNVTYCDVQGGWAGTGNIDLDPIFDDTLHFYLSDTSPCIDAGNPDPAFNDPEDPSNPGFALWPAMGTLRNDMGAYGGPGTGDWLITTIEDELGFTDKIPNKFQLFQNYPNPFNPRTVISWQLAVGSHVNLSVYNLLGQRVATLVDERKPTGKHSIKFNASKLASGIYYYQLQAGMYEVVKKMILIK
jgi:predicted outer membrane repeat protein